MRRTDRRQPRQRRQQHEQVALFCRQLRREAAAHAASQQRTLQSLDLALRKLTGMIHNRYPEATFTVSWGPDNGDAVHLYATVDRIDTDELVDLIINRELELQQQGIPVHVIPLRTPERNAEVRAQVAEERKHFSL